MDKMTVHYKSKCCLMKRYLPNKHVKWGFKVQETLNPYTLSIPMHIYIYIYAQTLLLRLIHMDNFDIFL